MAFAITCKGRKLPIEQIFHKAVELQLTRDLVRSVQVRDPVIRQFDVLVGLIADIPLAADPNHIGAELQSWRDRVIDAALDLVQRDAGNVLTGRNENISIRIRGGVVRRGKFSRKLIGGIDERVIEVEEPWRGLLLHPFRQTTLFSLVFLD